MVVNGNGTDTGCVSETGCTGLIWAVLCGYL